MSALRAVEPDLLADPERQLTVPEVARVLRVKASWCYQNKTLPWIKVGKYRRVFAKDVSAFLAELRAASMAKVMRHSRAQEIVDRLEPMD